jgi:hypothetical protein
MTEDYKDYIDGKEFETYATLNDAYKLIDEVGMLNFLLSLYSEKQSRLLTIEEQEAMQVLHNSWEL